MFKILLLLLVRSWRGSLCGSSSIKLRLQGPPLVATGDLNLALHKSGVIQSEAISICPLLNTIFYFHTEKKMTTLVTTWKMGIELLNHNTCF